MSMHRAWLIICALLFGFFAETALAQQAAVPGAGQGPQSVAPPIPTITNAPGTRPGALPTRPTIINPADAAKLGGAEQEKPRDLRPPAQDSPPNDFQEFVARSLGRTLPLFGHNLFDGAPSTFAPVDRVPVTPDYIIGPGDEIVVRAWGQVDIDYRAVVDPAGAIHIPQIGTLTVAGLRYQDLHGFMRSAVGRVFRNFDLSVNLGQLRSIQVFVVGQARRPGAYTVSSLSTLVNALFASGGPSAKGTMRGIQLKRGNQVVTDFDVYDLLIKGDKSRDVRLLPGDIIYIPPVGRLVAITGSVSTAAIYELKDNTTLADLIALAGGLTTTASGQKVTVERITDRTVRKVDEFLLDAAGTARPLQDGDVVTVFTLSPRFENAVVLQGHVAGPARYPWREGMRVTDLLVDKNALIPAAYWERQNRGMLAASYTKREINWDYAVVQRLDAKDLTTRRYAFNLGKAIRGDTQENMLLQPGDIVTIYSADDDLAKTENDIALRGSLIGKQQRFVWRQGMRITDVIPDSRWLIDYYNYWSNLKGLKGDINWDYANIVRLQPDDLTKTTIAFDLGKAILGKDPNHDMMLRPGDEIEIFSKDEVVVPVTKQGVYVRAEGEVNHAGTYRVMPGETLRQFIVRIGGLAPSAYLFGAEFTRESTRVLQQKRLEEAVDKFETEVRATDVLKSPVVGVPGQVGSQVAGGSVYDDVQMQEKAQAAMLAKMRATKATGRIVLEIPPGKTHVGDLPELALEDGDRFYVPPRPSTVLVMGRVYNPSAFIYREDKRLNEYLALAGGPTRDADAGGLLLLRADGSVISKRQTGLFNRVESEPLVPGDTIVLPVNLRPFLWVRELKDWTQIFFQFAIGVAGLKVLRDF